MASIHRVRGLSSASLICLKHRVIVCPFTTFPSTLFVQLGGRGCVPRGPRNQVPADGLDGPERP